MKEENSTTCHNALIEHQMKYGDDALTENEKQFLYGIITYKEFKYRVTHTDDTFPTKE